MMIAAWLGRFARSTSGSLSVESMFVLPIMIWAIMGTMTFWDAYKASAISARSTHVLADMVSREAVIDEDYLERLHQLFTLLSNSTGESALRVSFITGSGNGQGNAQPEVVWSEGVNADGRKDIGSLNSVLPKLANGESLVVIETKQAWTPAFAVGLLAREFQDIAIVRPRFAPLIEWEDGTED